MDIATRTAPSRGPRSVGRPRRLTVHQVLDSALELGLEGLSMSRLAEHLGVGIATLYRYVSNRDELIRMAAARKARGHRYPDDEGQHWSAYVMDYAHAVYDSLAGESQLITCFIDGGLGPEVEIETADGFVAALAARGFALNEAMQLMRSVGQIVVGAAAASAHVRAINATGATLGSVTRRALAHRGEDEVPTLRRCADAYADETSMIDWKPAVERVLRSVAAERGEQLSKTE